jgi:hypothetical protein
MRSEWFSDCKTEEDKEQRRRELRAASAVLERLSALVGNKTKDSTLADYNSPSWAYLQADKLGWNRALTTVQELIKMKE